MGKIVGTSLFRSLLWAKVKVRNHVITVIIMTPEHIPKNDHEHLLPLNDSLAEIQ